MVVGMENFEMSPKKMSSENETIAPPELMESIASTEPLDEGISSADLATAASEWATDPTVAGHSEESESEKITLMTDPFHLGTTMPNVMDVAAAQNSDEELLLDEPNDDAEELAPLVLADNEAEIDETLARIQEKLAAQDAILAKEAAALAEAEAREAEERLAAQIAEDDALERKMKEDAENELKNDPELRIFLVHRRSGTGSR